MSQAFQCDVCEEFKEGEPTLQMDVEVNVGGGSVGLFGGMFNTSDAGETLDLCSAACCREVDLNALRSSILDELEDESEHTAEPPAIDVEPTGDSA